MMKAEGNDMELGTEQNLPSFISEAGTDQWTKEETLTNPQYLSTEKLMIFD